MAIECDHVIARGSMHQWLTGARREQRKSARGYCSEKCIPITPMFDLPRLRARHPIITVSEYPRVQVRTQKANRTVFFFGGAILGAIGTSPVPIFSNIFETDQTELPSQFIIIIQNHWYDPSGTNRVDYIPEAKGRGKWERYPGFKSEMDRAAKSVLRESTVGY